MRYKYFYPDDVIVTVGEGGVKSAEVGYDWARLVESITLDTRMPLLWDYEDLREIHDLYLKAWERSRENYRRYKSDKFLLNVPSVKEDRDSWKKFLSEGNEPSITAWRKWRQP